MRCGRGAACPSPGKLKLGDELDGFRITALVADNGVHRFIRPAHGMTGELVAIKTLHEARASDPEESAMLAHEAWLGLRVAASSSGRARARPRDLRTRQRSTSVFDWHEGRTLEQLLAERQTFLDRRHRRRRGRRRARAVGRLHRQGVIHRDIKPANLHRGDGRPVADSRSQRRAVGARERRRCGRCTRARRAT